MALTFFVVSSCEDDAETFAISTSNAPVLSELSITQIELDANNTANPALTLIWQEADYGQQLAINYAIQFASENTFSNPVTAASVTGRNSITFSIAELNSAADNTGLNPFEWATLYTRVVSSLGTQSSNEIPSNVISFDVFPFFNYPFNDYYIVGNGTAPDWNNNNNNPALYRDPNDENVFNYTGLFVNNGGGFNDGRFKVLETKGLWQPQWGVTANEGEDDLITSGDIAGNPGTQDSDPGRFGVEATGFYTFTINFASRKFTIEPFDASGITSPGTLEVQGSGVASNVAMTPLNFDGHIWYANSVRLTPGDVSFLTDGGASWGSTTSFSGVATDGGGNIPIIVEDDYDIWFNDLTGQYIMVPLNL